MKHLLTTLAVAMLFLSACSKQDDCINEQLSCVNGAAEQGKCSCSPGYAGANCDQEKLPVSIQIKNIALQGYPNGACTNYDLEDSAHYKDADLYLALYHNNILIAHNRALANENYGGGPLIFNLQDWRLQFPHDGYELRLYDRDAGAQEEDELISHFYFFPYTRGRGFPEKIRLEGLFACQAGYFEYSMPYLIELYQTYTF